MDLPPLSSRPVTPPVTDPSAAQAAQPGQEPQPDAQAQSWPLADALARGDACWTASADLDAEARALLVQSVREQLRLLRFAFGGRVGDPTQDDLRRREALYPVVRNVQTDQEVIHDGLIALLFADMEKLAIDVRELRARAQEARQDRLSGRLGMLHYRGLMEFLFHELDRWLQPSEAARGPFDYYRELGLPRYLHTHAAALEADWCRELDDMRTDPPRWHERASTRANVFWSTALLRMHLERSSRNHPAGMVFTISVLREQLRRLFEHGLDSCGIAAADRPALRDLAMRQVASVARQMFITLGPGTGSQASVEVAAPTGNPRAGSTPRRHEPS
ncbi:hypothetical protein GT347_22885 [Xylophilus rhododendri]|uniref:Uncharacterized protein n=1 Tax=Xylophilus rhododendri TaxID=2697032 RepID=A0A857JBH5_9BURK|nr:hypothetical protein [Xylophilus rhododendri]QHJ00574.1 hypothetical protein GT347_22885 [Xylophilus rhododendri]